MDWCGLSRGPWPKKFWPRPAKESWLPIFYLAVALTGFAILGVVLVPAIPYRALIAAVPRIAAVGTADHEFVIPPGVVDYELKDFGPRQLELDRFTIEADQPVSVQTTITAAIGQFLGMKLVPGIRTTGSGRLSPKETRPRRTCPRTGSRRT